MSNFELIVEQTRILSEAYAQPWRKYHSNNHITNMMNLLDDHVRNVGGVTEEEEGILSDAILYHDVVYNIPSKPCQNEIDSALYYRNDMSKFDNSSLDENQIDRVVSLIVATAHHFDGTLYGDHLINLMLDFDIMSFVAPYNYFVETNKAIDAEYLAFLPAEEVHAGREKFLRSILKNRSLRYRALPSRAALEVIAYQNVARYLREEYKA